jgi:hypothetical protein
MAARLLIGWAAIILLSAQNLADRRFEISGCLGWRGLLRRRLRGPGLRRAGLSGASRSRRRFGAG